MNNEKNKIEKIEKIEETEKLQNIILNSLSDGKAKDIKIFDTENLSPLFERVIITTGSSNRQTRALAENLKIKLKENDFEIPKQEGEESGEWIVVDCNSCVVHIMIDSIRKYYNLEELWGKNPIEFLNVLDNKNN